MAKRPQRPKFLWNNAYLEKLAIELGDECIFLCLSPVSFRMLADMSKMLLWATRYEEGAVAELGKTAYRELNVPCLTDFYSLLDELNNKDWLQSQFDDLGSRMTELEDMDVIVNQTVNGGCGCGCDGDTASTSTTTTIPPFGENDTGDMPAYDDTPIVIADSEKCRAANYLAFKVVSMIRGLGNMGAGAATVAGIVTIFLTIVAWLTPIPGDEILSTSALFYYAFIFANGLRTGSFALDVFNNLADVLEADMQAFVCALYDWNTAEDLGNTLTSIIDDKIDSVVPALGLDQEATDSIKTILDGLFGSQLVNWFVSNAGTIVPADFIPQYDCVCGATGDTCPTQNIVLAGLGNFPAGDLTVTTQGFASEFNSQTGYHEIIFELDANYCVTIENGAYTPAEAHEKCSDGVMVASDGSCIRRFVARSGDAFGTAVTFNEQTVDCLCMDAELGCIDMTTQSNSENSSSVKYQAEIDDANELWTTIYRLNYFGASVASVTGATLDISLQNQIAEQENTVIGFMILVNSVWEEIPITTAGNIGAGGSFSIPISPSVLSDIWSGNVGVYVRNSSAQDNDIIPPQTITFGNFCLHGTVQ